MVKIPTIRIRKPKNLTGFQLGMVIFLGVASGYYIWKPLIVESIQSLEKHPSTEEPKK